MTSNHILRAEPYINNVLAQFFSNFDVHTNHLEILLELSQSGREGGWRVYISNQFSGDADTAGPHHTWDSKTLVYPDCLYIKMLPLNLLSQNFFAFLCSQPLGTCSVSFIFCCGSTENSKGSMSHVANLESVSASHVGWQLAFGHILKNYLI